MGDGKSQSNLISNWIIPGIIFVAIALIQGSATPGTRATCGTREDILKLLKHAFHSTMSVLAMSVLAVPVTTCSL